MVNDKIISNGLKKMLLKIIRIYQKTISPDYGFFAYKHPAGYCKYYPSCSEYGYQAISKYGVIKGSFKAITRILRCNPFSKGGYDPVE